MDSIDEIDKKKRRSLENAQRISAYMRTSANKATEKAASELKPEVAPEEDKDKLDFSSEFTSQDAGLSSQGGAILDWAHVIEEDEERSKSDDEEEDKPSSGGEQPSSQEQDAQDEAPPESAEPEATVPEAKAEQPTPSEPPRVESAAPPQPASSPDTSPPPTPPVPARAPNTDSPAPRPSGSENAPVAVVADPEAPPVELSWGSKDDALVGSAEPVRPSTPRARDAAGGTLPSLFLERPRPVAHLALPERGQLAQVAPEIASTARLLIATPENEPGYEECVRLLGRFGLGALRMCVRQKVQVQILDAEGFATQPALLALDLAPEETPSDGAYLVNERLVLVDRRALLEKPRFFHPALYYFAHAFDHAQGIESFSSQKAAAVVACFEASTRGFGGFDFVDELAAADPVRYFARSVAVYLGRDDCDDPLWSHQDLFDFDRSMYDYLAYLFGRFTT